MRRPNLSQLEALFVKLLGSLQSATLGRCAVLIDGDNVPSKIAKALFAYAKRHGRLASAQLFANFAGGAHASWAPAIRHHGITAVQLHNSTTGKNAADIALAVAAIDLLHTDRIDTFVIVTSDGDLAPVVHRLKRSGAQVHGVGARDASPTFRESCDAFLSYPDLLAGGVSFDIADEHVAAKHRGPRDAEQLILQALVRLGGHRDWVEVQRLGQELQELVMHFNVRHYRRRSLTDLLRGLDSVEVDLMEKRNRVRLNLGIRNGQLPIPETKS